LLGVDTYRAQQKREKPERSDPHAFIESKLGEQRSFRLRRTD